MSAKRLETIDVVADVATGARARRFRGGSEARARRCRYVSRVLAGTRGRARGFAPQAPPEVRIGRCTLRGAGDAKRLLKRRESAREARAGARETVMLRPRF